MGLYRCVSITGRYEAARPLSREAWKDWIGTALASVVEGEPYLRVGIVDEDSTRACFVHVPRIDLDKQVAWHSAPCASEEEYKSALGKVLEDRHDSLWPDTGTRPPWKATVVDGSADPEVSRVDIIYSWHHAIGDGLSGKIFHESLLSALRLHDVPSGHPPIKSPELHFPDPPVLPPPQEEVVKFTLSWWYIFKTLWAEIRPSFLAPKEEPVWAGGPVDFQGPYRTRVRLLDVDGETRDGLLVVCRIHKTTLTGLVHALTLLSLARQLPSERVLTSQTPMSLRPYVSAPATDLAKSMSVLVGTCIHQFPADQVRALQSFLAAKDENPAALEGMLWEIAADVKTELMDKAASLPADDVMGLLSLAGDWRERFRQMDGKPPKTTWEVSNVGVISGDDGSGGVRISRLLFSQSATLTGSALNTSVAGCEGDGGVGITWTWPEGVLEEGLVEGVGRDIEMWIGSLARNGRL